MIVIMACGNELREDDGAGLLFAQRLEQAWRSRGQSVRRVVSQQLAPEMALELIQEGVSAVIFVDTRLAASPEDRLVQIAPLVGSSLSPSTGHHLAPDLLLAYAGLLSDDPLPPVWLATVPGMNFGFGDTLSEIAETAIQDGLQTVDQVISAKIMNYQAEETPDERYQ